MPHSYVRNLTLALNRNFNVIQVFVVESELIRSLGKVGILLVGNLAYPLGGIIEAYRIQIPTLPGRGWGIIASFVILNLNYVATYIFTYFIVQYSFAICTW